MDNASQPVPVDPGKVAAIERLKESTKKTAMLPYTGKGKELQEFLRKELGIPERCQWFEVRFAVEEIVTVKCEFQPEEERG